jgi:HKD family nuclease
MKTLLYENQTIKAYQDALTASDEVSLAFALVTKGGLGLLKTEIQKLLKRGGTLKFLVGVDMASDPEAIEWLHHVQRKHAETFALKVFQSGDGGIFHPKFGIFTGSRDRRSAILGSSNLTGGGMVKNLEVNLFLDDASSIKDLDQYFYELFEGGRARPVSDTWLETYSKHWTNLKKVEEAKKALRAKLPRPQTTVHGKNAPIPNRIRGFKFAFTGKIEGYPRDLVLFPLVEKLGGTIALRYDSMASADALVHGNVMGGSETTKKLEEAKLRNIPVISEDEFFKAVAKEKQVRARKR